jgi:hypothetical protein
MPMRLFLFAAALVCTAAPAAAQHDRAADSIRGAADAVAEAGPAIDRSADALLDLDIGPILDARDGWRDDRARRRHRTLREMARRDDPYFEQRLHASIRRGTVRMSRAMSAIAAAEPALRRSLIEMEANVRAAIDNAPPAATPPGDADDDWDRDDDDAGPDDEPYEPQEP